MALRFFPHRTRPAILAVASSDSGVVVEPAKAYGARAWRVIIPPVTQVGLALRVGNAATPPSLQAWTEPALASHNRQLAVFITAVGSLIAAAALITARACHPDRPFRAALGGAYALHAVVELAGGHRHVRRQPRHIDRRALRTDGVSHGAGVGGGRQAGGRDRSPARSPAALSPAFSHRALWPVGWALLAYLGVPGATFLTDLVIVPGSAAIALYLIVCGRRGMRAAQVIAPSAAAFALVALAAAVTSLGGLGRDLTAPAATGGFAAAARFFWRWR